MPIGYYSQYYLGASVVASSIQATTADDYLAQAKALLGKKGGERDVIKLAGEALATRQSAEAYFYRAYAKDDLGDKQGAIADLSQAIAINPRDANVYNNRGNAKSDLGDKQGAIADYNQALVINPQNAAAYNNRGNAKSDLGDKQGVIADYNQALAINPQIALTYYRRGKAKSDLGDKQGACLDYKKAASLGAPATAQWLNSDGGAWCRNMP